MDQNSENKSRDSYGGIKFQDSGWRTMKQQQQTPESPKIIRLAIKLSGGLVKDEKQASYVLIGFVVAAIVIFLIVIFSGGSSQPTPGTIPPGQFVPQ